MALKSCFLRCIKKTSYSLFFSSVHHKLCKNSVHVHTRVTCTRCSDKQSVTCTHRRTSLTVQATPVEECFHDFSAVLSIDFVTFSFEEDAL